MPEIVADLPPRCSSAAPGGGIQHIKDLVLIPLHLIRATRAGALRRAAPAIHGGGRAAYRIRGAACPISLPVSIDALSKLLDRKPHLWRPIGKQLLPPPLAVIDPAERLGIDLMPLRTAEDCRQVLAAVLAAIAQGEITPAEGARIAKRLRARVRLFAKQMRAQFRALSRRAAGVQTRPRRRARTAAYTKRLWNLIVTPADPGDGSEGPPARGAVQRDGSGGISGFPLARE